MQIKWFRNVRFKNDWELNFVGKVYNLRIGRSQVTFWKSNEVIFNLFPLPQTNITEMKGSN